MLFRNQISTQNSTHAGKYFHKSEAEHEHTGTSERGSHVLLTMRNQKNVAELIKKGLLKVNGFKNQTSQTLYLLDFVENHIFWLSQTLCRGCYSPRFLLAVSHRHTCSIYFLFMFLHFNPSSRPLLFPSFHPVDCHWAEITPVLLTHLGTRVKHTQGETWWGSFAESH